MNKIGGGQVCEQYGDVYLFDTVLNCELFITYQKNFF